MPSVVIYRPSYLNQVSQFIQSVDPTPYNGRPDVKIYDDRTSPTETTIASFLSSRSLNHTKVSGDDVVDMTAQEIIQVDADEATVILLAQRTDAVAFINSPDGLGKILRAVVILTVDELNILRQWVMSFKAAVAAATSLADLKTRVAALPNLNDRTNAQARNAIEDHVDNGNADE